jgi:hypothetical protein
MSGNSNSIFRIFLSSTAIDMQEHRQKVSDAILRLGDLPVGMGTFGAMPNDPVDVCKTKVRESNALVVMLAHRYGWVPLKEEGGDGKKSITWIEVEAALENGIPVFAYLVDKNFGWMHPKEQDFLSSAKDKAEALAIFEKVQALNDFKGFLEGKAGLTRDFFTIPDNLVAKVAIGLSKGIIESKIHCAIPDYRTALGYARNALDKSQHPEIHETIKLLKGLSENT